MDNDRRTALDIDPCLTGIFCRTFPTAINLGTDVSSLGANFII